MSTNQPNRIDQINDGFLRRRLAENASPAPPSILGGRFGLGVMQGGSKIGVPFEQDLREDPYALAHEQALRAADEYGVDPEAHLKATGNQRTLGGDIAQMAGQLGGELPLYLLGGGALKVGANAIGAGSGLASRVAQDALLFGGVSALGAEEGHRARDFAHGAISGGLFGGVSHGATKIESKLGQRAAAGLGFAGIGAGEQLITTGQIDPVSAGFQGLLGAALHSPDLPSVRAKTAHYNKGTNRFEPKPAEVTPGSKDYKPTFDVRRKASVNDEVERFAAQRAQQEAEAASLAAKADADRLALAQRNAEATHPSQNPNVPVTTVNHLNKVDAAANEKFNARKASVLANRVATESKPSGVDVGYPKSGLQYVASQTSGNRINDAPPETLLARGAPIPAAPAVGAPVAAPAVAPVSKVQPALKAKGDLPKQAGKGGAKGDVVPKQVLSKPAKAKEVPAKSVSNVEQKVDAFHEEIMRKGELPHYSKETKLSKKQYLEGLERGYDSMRENLNQTGADKKWVVEALVQLDKSYDNARKSVGAKPAVKPITQPAVAKPAEKIDAKAGTFTNEAGVPYKLRSVKEIQAELKQVKEDRKFNETPKDDYEIQLEAQLKAAKELAKSGKPAQPAKGQAKAAQPAKGQAKAAQLVKDDVKAKEKAVVKAPPKVKDVHKAFNKAHDALSDARATVNELSTTAQEVLEGKITRAAAHAKKPGDKSWPKAVEAEIRHLEAKAKGNLRIDGNKRTPLTDLGNAVKCDKG